MTDHKLNAVRCICPHCSKNTVGLIYREDGRLLLETWNSIAELDQSPEAVGDREAFGEALWRAVHNVPATGSEQPGGGGFTRPGRARREVKVMEIPDPFTDQPLKMGARWSCRCGRYVALQLEEQAAEVRNALATAQARGKATLVLGKNPLRAEDTR